MSLADDYIIVDATALADLVRQRHVSPAELVETAIARLEQVEPKLAGMAEWTLDQARRAARGPVVDAPFAGVQHGLTGGLTRLIQRPFDHASQLRFDLLQPRDCGFDKFSGGDMPLPHEISERGGIKHDVIIRKAHRSAPMLCSPGEDTSTQMATQMALRLGDPRFLRSGPEGVLDNAWIAVQQRQQHPCWSLG